VDFLVNISNDGWFKCTSEHEEHLAVSRFRAVECRRALCRAVNMGISAVIDGNGRVRRSAGADLGRVEGHRGGRDGGSANRRATSVYAWAGDWLPCCCWIAWSSGACGGEV